MHFFFAVFHLDHYPLFVVCTRRKMSHAMPFHTSSDVRDKHCRRNELEYICSRLQYIGFLCWSRDVHVLFFLSSQYWAHKSQVTTGGLGFIQVSELRTSSIYIWRNLRPKVQLTRADESLNCSSVVSIVGLTSHNRRSWFHSGFKTQNY